MDTKNVIAAISLSAAVIILYSLFFAPSPNELKKIDEQKSSMNSEAPKLEESEKIVELSRDKALKESNRVEFENQNIKGSISLMGGTIDDLIFKNYTETLDGKNKITLLNPKKYSEGYFVETGWVSSSKNIELPNSNTNWKVEGNNKLTPGNPVTLVWNNNQGISFKKKIKIDEKFLFSIDQIITNQSEKSYDFYAYGQIIRNKSPEVTNFYILHEGLIGVLNDQLVEKDYDDIEEKEFSQKAETGWLGITDKYWITTLIPEKNKEFRADFNFKNKFRANFIETKPLELESKGTVSSNVRVIVAAKEVDVIDSYAEKSNISKFDLAIDWGWFYFFTKNFFFAIDYFFKLTGNFGIAIVLITICIRILFYPLANYSFKSMAKMKVLQPEMTRLKELHKDDKMKLQQEMMALYKKEKVNPVSGCLPIFIQIPFFFAIYKVLFVTLEMRHQPFYGWIKDLSERDPTSIFNLFGLIPWDPPSFLIIGVWPCLMGLTMYLQQKLNPTPPDPIQQKIFMFFPLFLTIILAPFPSGLVIYWTINNVLTMAQQLVIMRQTKVKTT
jgi:YidC/Oxa1 family membrane protein insertase